MSTYNENTGRYQDRAEFYYKLLPENGAKSANPYLEIYRIVTNLYAGVHLFGIHFLDDTEWRQGLETIRETEGLSRCWGRVLEIIELWQETGVDNTAKLENALESLLDGVLEVLPAYVFWVPKAVCQSNQALLNFLQQRGNIHRRNNSPKYYAYDRVLATLSSVSIPVTVNNCRYFKGVGPRIGQHIIDFLSGKVEIPIVDLTEEEPPKEVSWIEVEPPELVREENRPIATYLWKQSLDLYQQGMVFGACAWRRASESLFKSKVLVEEHLETLEDDFPYVGEKLSDVIREFYYYVYPTNLPPTDIPDTCPTETLYGVQGAQQRELIKMLWEAGFQPLAVEIAERKVLPAIKSNFQALHSCTPEALSFMFDRTDGIPPARNWLNTELVEWLWECGRQCIGNTAYSYFNASRIVAHKVAIVDYNDLESVKYIGPHIAERARGEILGQVNPEHYKKLRQELNHLRALLD